jgi:hypothetical protein
MDWIRHAEKFGNMTHLERGVVRTPSTLVREGRVRFITVGVIKVLVGGEGEGVVKMAILSTPTGEEMVGVSRCSETLGPGKDGFGFELPCRCGVTEGIGETCVALGASLELNTLPVGFKGDELVTEVVDGVTAVITGVVLLLESVDEGILFEEVRPVRVRVTPSGFGGDDRMGCKCTNSAEGSVLCVAGKLNDNDELQPSKWITRCHMRSRGRL